MAQNHVVRGDLPAGTVTFLFTDIEGSTPLLHELGPVRYADALQVHRRVVREAVALHGGVEVDTQGDAFFVAFPTAEGALEAAAAMLTGLADGPIRVRMGIHTGTPHLAEEGYVGIDVHRAARIAAAGHGGQVLVSATTAEAASPAGLRELGEHRLKDFDQPVPIYQLGPARFPPLKTISNTNLPRPASSFVGREGEVREIVSLLRDGARLVTLTGPGGSGKTRLAVEAATELVPAYKAGVFWVPLAPVRDAALVVETIAQTLGAKDGLADHIAERELLLVVDNFEHVIGAASELASLAEAAPNLRLLTTSRELLRVRGEVEYPVVPLVEQEGVELFTARAGLEPDDTVRELCRALENLPLALELAAARTRALSPAQILARLGSRLDLLKGGRDADPRQQTLRATIEWSYELLDPEEQRLLARLSAFAGGCTVDAAEEVCGADLDVLQSLFDKSLLRRMNERFWMLETIREFAVERLDELGDSNELRRRHAQFYVELAERALPELVGPDDQTWWARMTDEYANFRTALDWSCGGGDGKLALRLTGALWRFWWVRGPVHEAQRWYEAALALGAEAPEELRARALYGAANMTLASGEADDAVRELEECLALFRRLGDDAWTARTLNDLGIAHTNAGRSEEAAPLHAKAAELALACGDLRSAGASWICLGYALLQTNDSDHATEWFLRARTAFAEAGDQTSEGSVLENLALAAQRRGDVEDAARWLAEAIPLLRRVDERYTLAHALVVAAAVLEGRRDDEAATRILGGAQELCMEMGHALDPVERDLGEQVLAGLRRRHGAETLEALIADGSRLGYEETVELALRALHVGLAPML